MVSPLGWWDKKTRASREAGTRATKKPPGNPQRLYFSDG